MTDRYAVFGHPIAHSKSPLIHAAFARQTGQDMTYEAILAPTDGFADSVAQFIAAGGRGANVTVPFKEQAFALANRLSPRAEHAGAVNTLAFDADGIFGDNTDGAGLVADLVRNLRCPLAGKRILLVGAGGAARGVIGPLLDQQPATLVIANRTVSRAQELAEQFGHGIRACGFDGLDAPFDLVLNATAASLAGELPPLSPRLFTADTLAYDMMYGRDTPFLAFARTHGAATADGLGMLVEQAAEAFYLWRGVRPDTAPVIASLRQDRLEGESLAASPLRGLRQDRQGVRRRVPRCWAATLPQCLAASPLRGPRRAKEKPAPGFRRRWWRPIAACSMRATRIRWKPGTTAGWSAASTAWRSAACSMANRCSAANPTPPRSRWCGWQGSFSNGISG